MRKLTMKTLLLFSAMAAGRFAAADGGLPPVPEQVFAGCINGRVNIWVSKEGSFTNHWFQMRLPHEGRTRGGR